MICLLQMQSACIEIYKNPGYCGETTGYGGMLAVEQFYHRKLKFQWYFSPGKSLQSLHISLKSQEEHRQSRRASYSGIDFVDLNPVALL